MNEIIFWILICTGLLTGSILAVTIYNDVFPNIYTVDCYESLGSTIKSQCGIVVNSDGREIKDGDYVRLKNIREAIKGNKWIKIH